MLSSSLIICTKDRQAALALCLDSFLRQTRPVSEVVVVDAGSDGADAVVGDFADNFGGTVQYLRSEPGLTRQRNLGIEAATGDVVHFLDDDVVVEPDYVEAIQGVFQAPGAEDVVGVSPMVREGDRLSALGVWLRRVFLLPHVRGTGRHMPSGFGSFPWNGDDEAVREIEIACGCCAYRRDVFEQVGFDEFFSGYGYMEDLEFSLQVRKLGRILLNPQAVVWHEEATGGRPDLRRLSALQALNHDYVFRKHLPQDAFHRLCYWWAVLGDGLLKLAQIRHNDWAQIAGWVDGRKAVWRARKSGR